MIVYDGYKIPDSGQPTRSVAHTAVRLYNWATFDPQKTSAQWFGGRSDSDHCLRVLHAVLPSCVANTAVKPYNWATFDPQKRVRSGVADGQTTAYVCYMQCCQAVYFFYD